MIVNVRCTECAHQANLNDVSIDNLERIVVAGWGIPQSALSTASECDCPCHSGVGLLPRLHVSLRKTR